MTPEEQTILKLTRENIALENKIKDVERERAAAEMHLAKADVPTGFEDGNSWDDYRFSERVGVLSDMHARVVAERDQLTAENNRLRELWTEARVVVAKSRDANCCVSYGAAQVDAVEACNAWLNKMPA